MDHGTIETILEVLAAGQVATLDITGGAPELHAGFRHLVSSARALDVHVIDRCNLTILEEAGFEDLAEFLAHATVEIVASLPCYLEDNVDAQRGDGVFSRSLAGLRRLNGVGYGHDPALPLNLVYNPQGPSLPPPQEALERAYKEHLGAHYGIVFNRLLTLANMPIARFGSTLVSKGEFESYMATLRSAHQAANLEHVMCRDLISVDWRGYLYDCDFNQMLDLGLQAPEGSRRHVRDLLDDDLSGHPIRVRDHCFGCTAGQGSSCGGALAG